MYGAPFHSAPVLGLLLLGASLWCSGTDNVAAAKEQVTEPAAGVFLVARRGMPDPRFARSVILLVRYGARGALGLIVNRPTRMSLPHAFPDVEGLQDSKQVMWFGGPVALQQAGLLVDSPQTPEQALTVMGSLHFSTSFELLKSLLAESAGSPYRVYAGHAGWAPAQLDGELARGDWHLRAASVEQVLAADTEALWKTLIGASGTWVMNDGEWLPRTISYPLPMPTAE
jgi:putative transcriptional regulator